MAKKIRFNGFKFNGLGDDDRILFVNLDSSNLKAIAYDLDAEHLYVLFKSNPDKRYVYLGVSSGTFLRLAKATSPGSHFVKRIRNKYEFAIEENK